MSYLVNQQREQESGIISGIAGPGRKNRTDHWSARRAGNTAGNTAIRRRITRASRLVMITIGEGVTGGELWYDGRKVPTLGRAVLFDGNLPHMTLPYTGTRYSIVCYTFKAWVSKRCLLSQLRVMGFPTRQLLYWQKERKKYIGTGKKRIKDARTKAIQQMACGEIPLSQQRLLVKPFSALTIRRHEGRAPYPNGEFKKKKTWHLHNHTPLPTR